MNAFLRPRVTIVMPVTAGGQSLKYALESVLWQVFDQFEVWIIGDKGNDRTHEVINIFRDPRIFWHNVQDTTDDISQLINEGIRRARGEYIAYISPNDIWLPNHLEVLVDFLDVNEHDIAYSILQTVFSDGNTQADIPLLPQLEILPENTVLVHRKSTLEDFRHYIGPSDASWFEKEEFFKWGKMENINTGMLPITTALKFREEGTAEDVSSFQPVYIDRLRRDPYFINKELSALLVRAQYEMHSIPAKTLLKNFWKLHLQELRNLSYWAKWKAYSTKLLLWDKGFFLHKENSERDSSKEKNADGRQPLDQKVISFGEARR